MPSVSDWVPSSAATSNSDINLGAKGFYGAKIRVGVRELSRGCRINDKHEAFADLTGARATYQNPPGSCGNCELVCAADPNDKSRTAGAVCVSGECRSRHATAVASRIASSQSSADSDQPSGPFHAAMVEFFLPEYSGGVSESLSELKTAYDWLEQNQVYIVNESIGANAFGPDSPGFSPWSVVSDWYARHTGMTIVRAAGNRLGKKSSGKNEVSCGGFNTICVGSSAWSVKPRDVGVHYWTSLSRWANPYAGSGAEAKELEKPDVLAEGERVHAAVADFEEDWHPNTGNSAFFVSGTSFAAPVVTGLVAMIGERCAGQTEYPLFGKAALRTHGTWIPSRAETATPTGQGFMPTECTKLPAGSPPPLYPAPHLGCDFYGGAGIVSSRYLDERLCPPNGSEKFPCDGTTEDPCPMSGSGVLNNESMGSQPPWETGGPVDWYSNSSKAALRQKDEGFAPLLALPGEARSKDTRIRMTFAYYSCPASLGMQHSSLEAANNLDLVLWGRRAGTQNDEIVFASEALDDTVEGFDVTLPADFQTLHVSLIGPRSLAPCPDAFGKSVVSEPYSWALLWGRQ